MIIILQSLALVALFTSVPLFAQDREHDQHQLQKDAASAKPASTKCCEGMDKMHELKHTLPMKGDMKAKIEKMKEKMAEKMGEKGMKIQTPESKVEKAQSTKDAHQHE